MQALLLPVAFPDLIQVTHLIDLEPRVNVVWNYVLQQYFRYPNFIIAPECRLTPQLRVDLAVIHVNTNTVVFVYRGKKAGCSHWDLDKNTAQLGGYLKALQKGLSEWMSVIQILG